MPCFTRFAFDAFACDRSVKFDHRFAALDGCIRATSNDATGFEKTLPRIRASEPIHSEPRWCEKQIADGVRGLHRWNHAEFREPRRSEEHTSELQSRSDLVCRLLLEKKK